jgi:formamidopyrimidine-DNA glycosylase
MPELPEVEVVRRGLEPRIQGARIQSVVVREPRLRWPIPEQLDQILCEKTIRLVQRRGKYLLLSTETGTLIIHLGMSGVLQFVSESTPLRKHDHIDIGFAHGVLRLNDPRRFGAVLWWPNADGSLFEHPLLKSLGVEPFDPVFCGQLLFACSRGRSVSIKQGLLSGHWVVGVGNIYASEALFLAGIDPRRAAGRVSLRRYEKLAQAIRNVLSAAIEKGGSTLRDFRDSSGQGGYFQIAHQVYDREGLCCTRCQGMIRKVIQGQRSTYFCVMCQN